MPTISNFYGIKITMYYDDHGIAHFHAKVADHEAKYNVETLELIEGDLPTAKQKLVDAWAILHHREIIANAKRIKRRLKLRKIDPLR